ncbi:hypothetical protein RND81_07G130800 [Saponaria officinalis]|uniref:Uncharacterized protein n=1 Tax=Saponaria officinalis TaxID=3572 RepID=A0AAW1JQJ6_SAPOF
MKSKALWFNDYNHRHKIKSNNQESDKKLEQTLSCLGFLKIKEWEGGDDRNTTTTTPATPTTVTSTSPSPISLPSPSPLSDPPSSPTPTSPPSPAATSPRQRRRRRRRRRRRP